jgi:abortive infection bacteriophage resistance protein
MADEIERSSEIFVEHYQNKYTSPKNPPAWMTLELASFGQLSILFKNVKKSTSSRKVAEHFLLHEMVFQSWLEMLSYIRNTCAHHSRLWNRKLPKVPTIPTRPKGEWLTFLPTPDKYNRLYISLACVLYLLRCIVPSTSFNKKLLSLLEEHPSIPVDYMGFPRNWMTDPFWHF